MLKKSNASAIIMSWLALFSALLTFAFWELLRNPSLLKDTTESQSMSLGGFAISLLAALAIMFLVFVLPGAFVIHNWDDAYFGKKGVVRWVVFGMAFGCLAQLQILIPKVIYERVVSSFFLKQLLGIVLSFIVFYASHWFAFKLVKGKNQ